jgi:hypothetical protein
MSEGCQDCMTWEPGHGAALHARIAELEKERAVFRTLLLEAYFDWTVSAPHWARQAETALKELP